MVTNLNQQEVATMKDEELEKLISSPANNGHESAQNQEPSQEEPATAETEQQSENAVPEKPSQENQVLEELKARLAQQEEEIVNLRKLNGSLSNKLGLLRKELEEKKSPEKELTDESFMESPVESVKKLLASTKRKEEMEQQEQTEKVQEYINTSYNLLNKTLGKGWEASLAKIAQLAIDEGEASVEEATNFLRNPLLTTPPGVIISYAKRLRMKEEMEKLRKEIEDLRKKPEDLLEKINSHQRQKSIAGNGKSYPAATGKITLDNLVQVSDEELEKFLKANQKRS